MVGSRGPQGGWLVLGIVKHVSQLPDRFHRLPGEQMPVGIHGYVMDGCRMAC